MTTLRISFVVHSFTRFRRRRLLQSLKEDTIQAESLPLLDKMLRVKDLLEKELKVSTYGFVNAFETFS